MLNTNLPPLPTIWRHDGRSRYYTVEGHGQRVFPSVTTILGVINKPALIGWANKEGRAAVVDTLMPYIGQTLTQEALDMALKAAAARPTDVRERAGDFGTRAHVVIEAIVSGQQIPIPSEMDLTISAFLEWKQQADIQLYFSETMVYSDQHGYAGGMDCLGWRGDKLVALDWKTSSGIYDEAAAQVSAYAMAWEEMTGQHCDEAWVIRLPKVTPSSGSGFEARQVNILAAYEMFLAAKRLYDACKLSVYLEGNHVS